MPSRNRRQTLRDLAATRGWVSVGEPEWAAILETLPNARTEELREAGIAAEAPWSGVAQHTFDELQTSLRAMSAVYENRSDLHRFCRAEVIRAKDRARIISRSSAATESTRVTKREMVEWMLVWLGDPGLFPAWVAVRQNARRKMADIPTVYTVG